MRTHQARCTTATAHELEFVDVTDDIQRELGACGIRDGQVTVFAADHACVLLMNERESGLLSDLKQTLHRLGRHAPADRRTAIGSTSLVVPAVDGRLRLGTWQRVLLLELEESWTRPFIVQIVGE